MRITRSSHATVRQANARAARRTTERMSSGRKLNRAADDPGNLGVSVRMQASVRESGVRIRNMQDHVSLNQTREGSLKSSQQIVQRVRELSVRAANGTLAQSDRRLVQEEINQLNRQIDANGQVRFNEQPVAEDINARELDLDSINVAANANDALSRVDTAMRRITTERSQLGAENNRLTRQMRGEALNRENMIAAESRIADTDFGEASVKNTLNELKTTVNVNMLQAEMKINKETVQQLIQ
jgi:flagellin